jgi:hemerythrin-like domain-containing protein
MVLSKLNNTVSYIELKHVEADDINKIADVYQINTNNIDILISVGREKHEQDISFFPIYLINKERKVLQIGVYELLEKNVAKYIDAKTGRINLEKLQPEPLIYAFATELYLNKHSLRPLKTIREIANDKQRVKENTAKSVIKEIDLDDEELIEFKKEIAQQQISTYKTDAIIEIDDVRKDIFSPSVNASIINDLIEESKRDALAIRSEYQVGPQDSWIQKFMMNRHFSVLSNEDGCVFSAIRDSFRQIGQETTIEKIRRKLSESITEETFDRYYSLYNESKKTYDSDNASLKKLISDYEKYKSLISSTIDKEERTKLLNISKQLKGRYDTVLAENNLTATLINDEFKFMKSIKNVNQFREKIKSCDFWADVWAISILERILNIKFIILSVKAYTLKDFANVLQCGKLSDTVEMFQPDFYIMLEHNGTHYKVISYKNKQIFSFKEIPYDIKKLVVNKCLERNAGSFSIIPEFIAFKKTVSPASAANYSPDIISDAKIRDLFDDNVQFVFYSGSSSKYLPGKGPGEKIPPDMIKIKEFAELHVITDWRKKLDNTWLNIDTPFTLDQYRWISVEHYMVASLYKEEHPEFFQSFSLDSGTELSKNLDLIKYAISKTGKGPDGFIFRDAKIAPDANYTDSSRNMYLYNAFMAKFGQNPEFKKILLLTKNAKLLHYIKGKEPEIVDQLMIVREKLKESI